MSLNRKVKEQNERADQILQQVYGKTEEAPKDPVAEKPQEVAPVEAKAEPEQKPVDDWEHKYRVLQGKYSAEVPRMSEEIRELKASIQELKEVKAPQASEVDLKSMTPESVVEQFGEDFAAAVGAIAERIAAKQGKVLRDEFEPKVTAVTERTAQTARQEFMRDLTAIVPDWKSIDVEDGFTAYLDEVDELSGNTRRDFFNSADASNNAQRIAKFFASYKATKAPVKPVPQVESRISIDNQLSPSTSSRSESVPGKRYWTQADIRKFYQDQRRGLISDQEAKRIESDIFAAQGEGRLAA